MTSKSSKRVRRSYSKSSNKAKLWREWERELVKGRERVCEMNGSGVMRVQGGGGGGGSKSGVWRREEEKENGQSETPTTPQVKKKRVRRAKLNDRAMTDMMGLPWVYTHLPDAFKKQYKGKGHEVRHACVLIRVYLCGSDSVG